MHFYFVLIFGRRVGEGQSRNPYFPVKVHVSLCSLSESKGTEGIAGSQISELNIRETQSQSSTFKIQHFRGNVSQATLSPSKVGTVQLSSLWALYWSDCSICEIFKMLTWLYVTADWPCGLSSHLSAQKGRIWRGSRGWISQLPHHSSFLFVSPTDSVLSHRQVDTWNIVASCWRTRTIAGDWSKHFSSALTCLSPKQKLKLLDRKWQRHPYEYCSYSPWL